MLVNLLWVLLALFCGMLPLSYWLGKLFLKVDIREYGDGNPGATNVWAAGGKWWGLTAILLDGFKGLIPVALALYIGGVAGWWLFPLALAPSLGHIYSPFLSFKGGKALATTFGVWTAITVYFVPLLLGAVLGIGMQFTKNEKWVILAGIICVLVGLLLWNKDLILVCAWLANGLLLFWRYSEKS
ncbi:MAG: glycerol-3-phosphate acyltransferase [Chloroflexota bacterium]|nr:MAG: glycerol-3-phosphate acyltransferase [Chloroflexota bacterium]